MDDEEFFRDGDRVTVGLWYPRSEGPSAIRTIQVGLTDVRAADDFEVTYDFDRDGYSIKREVKVEHDTWMEPTGTVIEIAFIPAWTVSEEA